MSSESAANARRMATLTGLPSSGGLAAGPVFLHVSLDGDAPVAECAIAPDAAEQEISRYREARVEARRQIEALSAKLGADAAANVFANHLEMLEDPLFVSKTEETVRKGLVNAECAIRRVAGEFREKLGGMDDPYLRERARDIEDVERRVLRILLGSEESAFASVTEPVVIVAGDLAPSDTLALPRHLVLGIATDHGSAVSHVGLLARAMGIPAVVGLGDVTRRVRPGERILVDGSRGTVTIAPDAATDAAFGKLMRREKELEAMVAEDRLLPGAMKDGTPLKIVANMQPGMPFGTLAAFGAQGVGLYRTEYLWIGADSEPDEEEQTAAYSAAVRAVNAATGLQGRVIFRCLDLGGDKLMRGAKPTEQNPFLGNRSIRWLLGHRDAFRTQLRAILRASALGKSAVMFPMISTVSELRQCNEELEKAKSELRAAGVAFDGAIMRGAMIETPAAAMCADQLAAEVDFFSIGTNDLVQYAMAADRGNEQVAYLSKPSDPAVVRLVENTCRRAKEGGIHVCVCGESAADPVMAVLWVGLGVEVLSMSASFIPAVKKTLRSVTLPEAEALAAEVLDACKTATADEIYAKCRDFLRGKVPEFDEIAELSGAV